MHESLFSDEPSGKSLVSEAPESQKRKRLWGRLLDSVRQKLAGRLNKKPDVSGVLHEKKLQILEEAKATFVPIGFFKNTNRMVILGQEGASLIFPENVFVASHHLSLFFSTEGVRANWSFPESPYGTVPKDKDKDDVMEEPREGVLNPEMYYRPLFCGVNEEFCVPMGVSQSIADGDILVLPHPDRSKQVVLKFEARAARKGSNLGWEVLKLITS